ncbi:hypothetical protein GJAV_G00244930 [Gymnothorax javanicus]|nr:hypothetical protein GJAV_G00244930 [Gymnothorax javanicus]
MKDKHKDSHSKDKERKMSSEQSKDKKTLLDKHVDKERDYLETKKEERKPEKVREKTWYKIDDIFTDESEDEEENAYNGGVLKLSDSLSLSDAHRKDATPDPEDMELSLSDKHRKFSLDSKQHSTTKSKEKDYKDKKKEKNVFDLKEKKGCLDKHKDKKEKESIDGKHKDRKEKVAIDSNPEKKSKQKIVEKKHSIEEKQKGKHKDKPDKDYLKDRKSSKGNGENEKSLLEKLEEEAMNDYKDDFNDKISEISSDSFTDQANELSSFCDSSLSLPDISEERRDSLSISYPQDKFREKERHRHSSSSSKKSHDKEKDKVKKEKTFDKQEKSEEIKEMYGRRESLPFEKEPMPLEADPYTFPFGAKPDGEDDMDKTLDFEREMSRKAEKDKIGGTVSSEKIKDKKKKEKHKDKVKEDKHKFTDNFGSFKHSKDDQRSGLKETLQVSNFKEKSKEDSPKFDTRNKDKSKDGLDKDNRADHTKSRPKEDNDRLPQSRDIRKDSRPRDKLLVDGVHRLTSFGKMLSEKDLEIEERHKRHKERMKQMEKLRHRSGDPKLKDKVKPEFESSSVPHSLEDKLVPVDRLDCPSPCFSPLIGRSSPRLESAQTALDGVSAAIDATDRNEHFSESTYSNFLSKPSTPVHRLEPQEPCLDIAAPPTPAPAALPPLDIDELSEPHHPLHLSPLSEHRQIPSEPMSGTNFLPPVKEKRRGG